MNINLGRYGIVAYDPDRITDDEGQTVIEALDQHLFALTQTTDNTFTGRQALLPETDLPDAYRVWNETLVGTWIWVNPDGEIVETADPMKHRETT